MKVESFWDLQYVASFARFKYVFLWQEVLSERWNTGKRIAHKAQMARNVPLDTNQDGRR